MASTLKALGDDYDERSRTPWSHIWSAAGVLMTVLSLLGGLAFYAITKPQGQIARAVEAMSEHMVTDKELVSVVASASVRRDDAQRVTDAQFAHDEADTKNNVREIQERLKRYVTSEPVMLIKERLEDLERRFNASRR